MKIFRIIILLVLTNILIATESVANEQNGTTAPSIIHFEIFQEDPNATPLSLKQAQERFLTGQVETVTSGVCSFGLFAPPVWGHLTIENPVEQINQIAVGSSWIDYLDIYQDTKEGIKVWRSGDETAEMQGFFPSVGFLYNTLMTAGVNEIWFRAESTAVFDLFVVVDSKVKADERNRIVSVYYGLLYGFLLALAIYNVILSRSLEQYSLLFYVGYILSFVILNLSHSGQLTAWLGPNSGQLRDHISWTFILACGVSGLLFASSYFQLRLYANRLWRAILIWCGVWSALIIGSLILGNQYVAGVFDLIFFSTFTVIMVAIGFYGVMRKWEAAGFFLVAVFIGMTGMLLTLFSAYDVIPYSYVTFHASEVSIMVEAVLLGIGMSELLHKQKITSLKVEYLAAHDPLTGLMNRRAFIHATKPYLALAARSKRTMSLMILDFDHFKEINDRFGHNVGDEALAKISHILQMQTRDSDLLARWGGDEFVLLMPETSLEKASIFAERIQLKIQNTPIIEKKGATPISLTVSIGVAEYMESDDSLKTLINRADMLLLIAKKQGRNQVMVSA